MSEIQKLSPCMGPFESVDRQIVGGRGARVRVRGTRMNSGYGVRSGKRKKGREGSRIKLREEKKNENETKKFKKNKQEEEEMRKENGEENKRNETREG
jgi:hypothetical protein